MLNSILELLSTDFSKNFSQSLIIILKLKFLRHHLSFVLKKLKADIYSKQNAEYLITKTSFFFVKVNEQDY